MTVQSDMALMAAGSYWDVRGTEQTPLSESNRAPIPVGYKVLTQYGVRDSGPNAVTGFSARVYPQLRVTPTEGHVLPFALPGDIQEAYFF